MTAQRRSPRRLKDSSKSIPEEAPQDEQPERAEENATENDASSKRAERASDREIRRKRSQGLRSKSTGVFGKIDTSKTSNKIVFDESDSDVDDREDSQDEGKPQEDDAQQKENEDDNVEEVKASVAKDVALELREQERKTAVNIQKLEHKKRKRKADVVEDEKEEMDEEFFAKLDADLDHERKEKRKPRSVPMGKHTTFVSADETVDTVQADHNIEVVVLGQSSMSSSVGTHASEAALIFSRNQLQDGKVFIKKGGSGNKKSKNKKRKPMTEGWTRSSKMVNRVLLGRKNRRSKPAATFVINTKT
jgi:hypothetical protein